MIVRVFVCKPTSHTTHRLVSPDLKRELRQRQLIEERRFVTDRAIRFDWRLDKRVVEQLVGGRAQIGAQRVKSLFKKKPFSRLKRVCKLQDCQQTVHNFIVANCVFASLKWVTRCCQTRRN